MTNRDLIKIKFICNPITDDCTHCEHFLSKECKEKFLDRNLIIPHYVLEYAFKQLSVSAFQVFMFINMRADFRSKSDHHAFCWLTYKQIAKAIRVKASNMRLYIREMEKAGLIKHSYMQNNKNGEFQTIHQFDIIWMKKRAEIYWFVKNKIKPIAEETAP